MKQGIIVRSTGSWYDIYEQETRTIYKGRLRGKFKMKEKKATNPLAVGDYVHFEQGVDDSVVITDILPRDNYIIRQSTHIKWQGHVIAANIDQALLVVTLVSPRTSTGFIDRFLISAEAYHIPAMLVFNKSDLLSEEGLELQSELMDLYEGLGYPCMAISALNDPSVEALQQRLQGKKTLIAGHSGVGKSTLLNRLAPEINQRVGEISTYADKGKHTTTFAEMFILEDGETYLIDTPGIKELGIVDIEGQELSHYFPEMRAVAADCRYHNCSHVHEPGCAVRARLDEGLIAPSRYMSYLSMLEGGDNRR